MRDSRSLETLLALDGVVIMQRGGYWTKFEVRRASALTDGIPHGIRYSLTLHDRYGKRIMGFDNAHPIKVRKGNRYQAWKTYDHWHRHPSDRGVVYEFVDAYQLISDFWTEVDRILITLGFTEAE
jgi:hypothetical protein